jgi:hypothetical protein
VYREPRTGKGRKGGATVIIVTANNDGTFTQVETDDVVWVRDMYTEPREVVLDCASCERPIGDTEFFTCLDTGEAVHVWCIKVDGDPSSRHGVWAVQP